MDVTDDWTDVMDIPSYPASPEPSDTAAVPEMVRVALGVKIPRVHMASIAHMVPLLCSRVPPELGPTTSDDAMGIVLGGKVLVIVYPYRWRVGIGWAPTWATKARLAVEKWTVAGVMHGFFSSAPTAQIEVVFRGKALPADYPAVNIWPADSSGVMLPSWRYPDPGTLLRRQSKHPVHLLQLGLVDAAKGPHTAHLDPLDALDVLVSVFEGRVYTPSRKHWPFTTLPRWAGDVTIPLRCWVKARVQAHETYMKLDTEAHESLTISWKPFKPDPVRQVHMWIDTLARWTRKGSLTWVPNGAWSRQLCREVVAKAGPAITTAVEQKPAGYIRKPWQPSTRATTLKLSVKPFLALGTRPGGSIVRSRPAGRTAPSSHSQPASIRSPSTAARATRRSKRPSSGTTTLPPTSMLLPPTP